MNVNLILLLFLIFNNKNFLNKNINVNKSVQVIILTRKACLQIKTSFKYCIRADYI
jgi:hypothetical protein